MDARPPVGKPDHAPGMVQEFLILPSADTRKIIGIVAGPERSSYIDLSQRPLLVVCIFDSCGGADTVILAVHGSPLKGRLSYCPGSCFGNGPTVRRLESMASVTLKDRLVVARYCDDLLAGLRKGVQR